MLFFPRAEAADGGTVGSGTIRVKSPSQTQLDA